MGHPLQHMTRRLADLLTRQRRPAATAFVIGVAWLLTAATPTAAVTPPSIYQPLAAPVLDADASLQARKGTTWAEAGVQYVLLEGDVSFRIKAYGLRADRAVVRIDTEGDAVRIRHLSIYLADARPLRDAGPTHLEADRLLVTVSTTGDLSMDTDAITEAGDAPGDAFVGDARRRFEQHLSRIANAPRPIPDGAALLSREQIENLYEARGRELPPRPAEPDTATPTPIPARPEDTAEPTPSPGATPDEDAAPPTDVDDAPPTPDADPGDEEVEPEIIRPTGVVGFHADRAIFSQADEGEATVTLVGGVQVVYSEPGENRTLTLTSDSAVIFLESEELGRAATGQVNAGGVKGVYLEDNVIVSDGDYTLRAPRVYYEITTDRALVLDAVFYTWDDRHGVPIYVRAEKIRQHSRTQWSASEAQVTTSEFAVPHFAIASGSVTFERDERPDGTARHQFVARHATGEASNVPLFYWPVLWGESNDLPLSRLETSYSDEDGPIIESRWDLFALIGRQPPEGVDLELLLDWQGDHNAGIGIDLRYEQLERFGDTQGYLLPYDSGDDDVGGRTIPQDDETRGYFHAQHREILLDDWELSAEIAYVSDETFLETFRPREAEEQKPYETSLYLKKQDQDWAFTFLAQYDLIGHTVQTPTLQSPGFTVDKLPELGYYRVATSLWDDRLTWYSENRAGLMAIRAGNDSPADRGFSMVESMRTFGIANTTAFDTALAAAGIPEDEFVARFDTRQEIQAPMAFSIFDVTPFGVIRFTAYDDDFGDFSPREDSQFRLWGMVGTRIHTHFSRTYRNVNMPVLDVHQLRHIIEPSGELWIAGTTIEREDLPVFDPDVEGITEGIGGRVGMRNTLQTQRGGPGRWRTVDWMVLNTDIVLRSDDGNTDQRLARYIAHRPEFSRGGDHFHADLAWMVSESFAVVAETNYSLEFTEMSEWRLGGTLQHSPDLSSYVDYVEIDPISARLLTYGFDYRLSAKYHLGFSHTIDLDGGDARGIEVQLVRQLPRWKMILRVAHDEINDEQSFAILLIPDGVDTHISPTFRRAAIPE